MSISVKRFWTAALCLALDSTPLAPGMRAFRFLEPDGCMGALEGSYPLSGTYAHPGAEMEVELGSTSMVGIVEVLAWRVLWLRNKSKHQKCLSPVTWSSENRNTAKAVSKVLV